MQIPLKHCPAGPVQSGTPLCAQVGSFLAGKKKEKITLSSSSSLTTPAADWSDLLLSSKSSQSDA